MHSKYREEALKRLANSLAEKEDFEYRAYEGDGVIMMEVLSKDHFLHGMKIKIFIEE